MKILKKIGLMPLALFLGALDFMLWNLMMSSEYGFRSPWTTVKENYNELKRSYNV